MDKLPIHRLYISNFLNIEEATLDLSPGVTGIVGANDQGKTNFLEALNSILDGTHDLRKIRDGATRSEIRVEELIGGEVVGSVSRIQTERNNRLEKKGDLHGLTPAKYLETIIDRIVVNPIKLVSEDPVKYLKSHLPIQATPDDLPENMYHNDCPFDLNQNAFLECEKQTEFMEKVRVGTYREKRHAQEIVEELKKGLQKLPEKPAFTEESLLNDAGDVKAKISNIERHNAERSELAKKRVDKVKDIDCYKLALDAKQKQLIGLRNEYATIDEKVARTIRELEQKIKDVHANAELEKKELEGRGNLVKEKIINIELDIKKKQCEVLDIEKLLENTKELSKSELDNQLLIIREKLNELTAYRDLHGRYDQLREKEDILAELDNRYNKEDQLFKYFEFTLPKKLIDRCNLPVSGIEFRDQQLYVEGRHIDRLATSKRALAAVKLSIALAKAKGHKTIGFDGAEVLDDENRNEFIKAIKDSGIRVIYTRWGRPEYPHEIEISNGKVRS